MLLSLTPTSLPVAPCCPFHPSLLVAARFKEASNAAEDILSRTCLAQNNESMISQKPAANFADDPRDLPRSNGCSKEEDSTSSSGDEGERLQAVIAAGAVYVQAMHARKRHGRVLEVLRTIFGHLSAVPPPVFLTW